MPSDDNSAQVVIRREAALSTWAYNYTVLVDGHRPAEDLAAGRNSRRGCHRSPAGSAAAGGASAARARGGPARPAGGNEPGHHDPRRRSPARDPAGRREAHHRPENVTTARGSARLGIHILDLTAEAERAVRKNYSASAGDRESFAEEVTLNIPPHTKSEIVFSWKEIRQSGTVRVTGDGFEAVFPYEIVVGLTFDQQQIDA